MAETAGYQGMIYYRGGYFSGKAVFLSSASTGTITMSPSHASFGSNSSWSFAAADTFEVSSTTSNDGDFTISAAASSVITVSGSGVLSNQTDSTTVLSAKPGTALAGFYNWTINYGADIHEVTDFSDSGVRTYVPGATNWTATATKRYSSASSMASWVGSTTAKHVRFFCRYKATPTASSTAVYLYGSAYVTTADTTTPVDGVVEQTINFQGTGALAIATKNNTWGS